MKQCAVGSTAAALLLVLLPRGTHALRGLADTAGLHGAHADNLGVDGRGDAVVHLAVELGEHVGCWGKEMGDDGGSVPRFWTGVVGSAMGGNDVRSIATRTLDGFASDRTIRRGVSARASPGTPRVGGVFFLGLQTHSRRRRTPGDRGWPRTRRCCERGSASPPCPWAPWSRRTRRTRA